jgi:hypothetical protein
MTELEYEEAMANFDLLIARVQKLQTDHDQLQEKFHSACFLLREAEDVLANMDSANYPLGSIMHFLEENYK